MCSFLLYNLQSSEGSKELKDRIDGAVQNKNKVGEMLGQNSVD